MSALRLARGFTGRRKILKFDGCYHGHADALLVAAGSGVATLGIPGSPGVPEGTVADTLVAPYNDLAAVERRRRRARRGPGRRHRGAGRRQHGLRAAARRLPASACATSRASAGALLIFDEVMTGFRVALGGAQERLRRQARPHLPGQDHRRRAARRRPTAGRADDHGPHRARRARLPGGHALRQPAGHGRGLRHPRRRSRGPATYERWRRSPHRLRGGLLAGGAATRHHGHASTASGRCSRSSSAPGPVTDYASAKTADTGALRAASSTPCSSAASTCRPRSSRRRSSRSPTPRPTSTPDRGRARGVRPRSQKLDPPHHEARQPADHEHDQRPHRRRVDHGRAAIDRAQHASRHASGSPANGGGVSPSVIAVLTKPGFTHTVRSPSARNLWSSAFEVAREPGLGRAVEHDRLAPALARDRARTRTACRRRARAGACARASQNTTVFAKSAASSAPRSARSASSASWVREQRRRSRPRCRSRRARASAASSAGANARAARRSQCAVPDRRAARRAPRGRARCASRSARVAAEQEQRVAALGHQPRERAAHAAGRAEERDLHARVSEQAHRLRAAQACARDPTAGGRACQRGRRGSIARKCSARVNASLAR